MPPGADHLLPVRQPERGTSHFVAVDRWGDVASETSTIESSFGSGLMVNGYYLNNELTDFSFVPEKDGCPVANRVEGGKRPRSSMSPTIVYGPDGRVVLAVGAAGGSTIPAQVIKTIIAVLDFHLPAQEAVALPMVYAPGDTLFVESGTRLEAMIPQLKALGACRCPAASAGHVQGQCDRMASTADGSAAPTRAARAPRSRNRGDRGEFGSATRTLRKPRFAVPDARRRERRRAVPVGQARGRSGSRSAGARRRGRLRRLRLRSSASASSPATASRWSAKTGPNG